MLLTYIGFLINLFSNSTFCIEACVLLLAKNNNQFVR